MLAAVLWAINDLRPEELALPSRLDVGQVLVDVNCATICGAQLGEASGAKGPDPYLPHLLGHEGAGTVEAVGPGVRTVKPGDRVVMHWRKGSGIDALPPTYEQEWTRARIGAGPVATFAQRAVVSENRATRIGDDVPFDVASLMGCAVTTAFGLVSNEAKVKIGESVLVIGCGGVGLNVIQAAKLAGAGVIVAVDLVLGKLDLARRYGADRVAVDVHDFGNVSFDVVVDCTGSPHVINDGLEMLAPGGRMVLVGQPKCGTDVVLRDMRRHYVGKTILDSQGGLTDPDRDIPRYLSMYRQGKINFDGMITERFPLSEVVAAFEVARRGTSGRVLLEMNGNG